MPFAKARWVDENGRSHQWSGQVASNDRNQVKSQIYAQTGAKKVILSDVTPNDNSSYRDYVKNHQEQERETRAQREQELKNGNSVNRPAPVRYSSSSRSSSGSQMDLGTSMGLLVLLGGLWAFFTFTPWILMLIYGPGSAWLVEKVTGQSIQDYNDTDNPTDGQHKKVLAIVLSAIIFGGAGFVHGSSIQKDLLNEYGNNEKVEQIRQENNAR
jgi:hypothetical protein